MRSTVLVDPIVLLFGKDIAQLIYQRLFKDRMKDINEQYRDIMYLCNDNGAVLMYDDNRRWNFEFKFNYRVLGSYNQYFHILTWKNSPLCHDYMRHNLPDNYWSIKELY
jgi:hypothetical protein